ncbi:hypothetical protein FNV43_RR09096 [Rhamnella rubrinervis]|uniref:beta-fructofuranosidase n=1 Tax=Rhamnella rubrinervis TaxID=2594499 RepID=A0A8K0HA66_9ROSA|nr:hypothetical protein FNV43_RR09096 [Rhamnella rubrinervis]
MVDHQPFLSVPVPEETITVTTSYGPLYDGAPANRRRPMKEVLIVFSGLLMVALLVAIIGSRQPDFNAELPSGSVAMSRGKSAGVSEKTNHRLFSGVNVQDFPWDNSMLSWQRTAYHFQPQHNWMNGPLLYKGWYHFFYQYNPNGAVWGDIVWGHAASTDMIHWLHLPLAMVADKWYDINGVWSGSATVVDDDKVVMLYTGSTNDSVQVQNLAYPADPSDPLLVKWEKYPDNPVLYPPRGIRSDDFRDPTTAWLTSEKKWRIIVGSKINKTGVSFVYDTEDFKSYKLLDGVLHAVPGTGMWECVDFYPVSLNGDKGLDTSANGLGVKHVVKASLDDDRHDYYAIGTYDEKSSKWVPDHPEIDVGIGIRYDYGVFYASKSFYDSVKKRRVLWGWIGETDTETADVKKGWASLQGIPRTVVLDKKTDGYLLQWPVEEIEKLRLTKNEFNNVVVEPGSVVPLDVGPAAQLDIVAEFELDKKALERTTGSNAEFSCPTSGGAAQRGALGPFGVLVLADDDLSENTPVYFYITKESDGHLNTHLCADQSRSSVASDVDKRVFGSFVPVLEDEKLSVRILVDHSIVESFAQGGRTCITSRVYPTKAIYGAARVFVFNNATDANVTASLKIWQMNSAFIHPFQPDNHFNSGIKLSTNVVVSLLLLFFASVFLS